MVEKNTSKFAILQISGTQLKVVEGGKYEINKLEGNKGDKVVSTDVLLVSEGENVKVGTPNVEGAKITYIIDSQKKGDKIDSFRYQAKARFRKRHGHRELITRILIEKIEA